MKGYEEKFVWLNFWDENNSNSFYKYICYKLLPIRYFLITWIFVLIIIVIASVQSFALYLQKSPTENSILIFLSMASYLVMIGIYTHLKDNFSSEKLYKYFVKKHLEYHDVVFILDDFDRIDSERREGLYSKLSAINSFDESLIIVVGDYSKLVSDQSIFTQKILNNIDEIPNKTNSYYVWGEVERRLDEIIGNVNEYDKFLITNTKEKFILDQRTYREGKQLLNLFEQEYITKNKAQINAGELLSICYIFQFLQPEYTFITSQKEKIYSGIKADFNSYPTNSTENLYETQQTIQELFKNEHLTESISDLKFIHDLFYFRGNAPTLFPSITNSVNFYKYQINTKGSSFEINAEFINQYFDSTLSQSINMLSNLTDEELTAFSNMLSSNLIWNDVNDKANYLLLLSKLVCAKYLIKGDQKYVTFSWQDGILYRLKELLERQYNIMPKEQYKKCVINLEEIDTSQKLKVLPLFVPLNGPESKEEQGKLFIETLQENELISIDNLKSPKYIYMFYRAHYEEARSKLNIEGILDSIFEFDNSRFVGFVTEKLISTYMSWNGSKNEDGEYLNLSNISYNNEFKEQFQKRLLRLEVEDKDRIEKLIKNEWDI